MALGKCRECGRQISSEAATCPGCGVERPVPRKPDIGRGRLLLVGIALIAGFAIIGHIMEPAAAPRQVMAQTDPGLKQQQKVDYQDPLARYKQERAAAFAKDRAQIIARIKKLNTAAKYDEAAKAANEFWDVDDSEFTGLKWFAEQKIRERIAVKARAEAKKQGVTIGMSKEEVRASSWGKPNHINSTLTVFGTHEQWVYDRFKNGYLYFDGDILTAIQN